MSREVLDSGSSDTDWDEPDVPPARSSVLRRRWRSPVVLVVAFLLGGAAGALGWNAWQDQQDAAVAASTIDLTARLRNAPTSEEGTLVQGYVLIENEGPETVRIEEIAIAGPGYVPRSDSVEPFRSGVRGVDDATHRLRHRVRRLPGCVGAGPAAGAYCGWRFTAVAAPACRRAASPVAAPAGRVPAR